MNMATFRTSVDGIFAAHGKAIPSTRVLDKIFDRCACLPDAFMAYAAKKLEDYERLPSNIGREVVQVLWQNYLAEHPEQRVHANPEGCDNCRNGGCVPGFFYAFDQAGKRWLFKCVCNSDERYDKQQSWTRHQAIAAGYSLTLPGSQQNKDHGAGYDYMRSVGHAERQRPRHTRALEEAEGF